MGPDSIQSLIQWDQTIFHLINEKWTQPFLDILLPICREKFTWIPLYLLIIYLWIKNYGWKGFYLILALAVSVFISDLLSAHWIKFFFHRLRPCQDFATIHHMIHRIDCGSGYSFVSSHAANHFTLAAFLALWFRKYYPYLEPVIYFWAALISYAQVYVGVHYPLDVLGGAFLGVMIGWVMGYFSLKWIEISKLASQTV